MIQVMSPFRGSPGLGIGHRYQQAQGVIDGAGIPEDRRDIGIKQYDRRFSAAGAAPSAVNPRRRPQLTGRSDHLLVHMQYT